MSGDMPTGPNVGGMLSSQMGPTGPNQGWAGGMINAGAAGLSTEGKVAIQGTQRQGKPWETFAGGLIAKLLNAIGFSSKAIADEIAQMSKSDPGEIVGMIEHAAIVGETPPQAQNLDEILGNSSGMLASVGVTGGIDTSGSVSANAPAASSGGIELA